MGHHPQIKLDWAVQDCGSMNTSECKKEKNVLGEMGYLKMKM